MFDIGAVFPPYSHRRRIRRYRENKKLFLGAHYDVFQSNDRLSHSQKELLYLSVNLPGIIAKKSADFLFGEVPTYSAGREDNAPEQKALERLVSTNHLNTMAYKSALGNAYRGDSFVKIRWGQKYNGALPSSVDPFRVFIENQNAEYVFPETMPGDATQIMVFHIAIPVEVKDDRGRRDWIISVESHYPGFIQYAQYRANVKANETDGTPTEWKIYAEIEEARRTVETGVPMPLVVHIPNYTTDDNWEGIDDLTEHKSVFDEINNRLSKIADILDKHADPALVVPSGTLAEDENGNATFVTGRDKVFEVMGKDDVTPSYVTWNGQLTAAFEELRTLIKLLLINAEIPEIALGSGDSGTSGSSGLAIKFRMNSLLAKINRKRQYYDKGLKEALLIAQMLEHARSGRKPAYDEPKINFKDGLPDDDAEQANIYAIRTGGKATVSRKTALMKLDGLTEEQADAEIKRMEDEEKAAAEIAAKVDGVNPTIFE
nr:phage portal protein [Paenibacillus sp. VKM B-2647]